MAGRHRGRCKNNFLNKPTHCCVFSHSAEEHPLVTDNNAWFSMKQHTPVIAAGPWLSPEGLLAYLLCRRHVSPIAPWVLWLFPMKDKLEKYRLGQP